MRFFLTILVLSQIFLSGCTNYDNLVRYTKNNQEKNYYTALAIGYRELAKWEKEQYDWNDADYFAKKGIQAYNREDVEPEIPNQREINNSVHYKDLVYARERLVKVVDSQTKIEFPLQSAHLQTLYDSWVEQIEEDWQEVHIKRIRKEFYEKLEQLRKKKKLNFKVEKKQQKNRNFYTIYFDYDSSDIDFTANKEINKIIYYLKSLKNYQIVLEGHTEIYPTKEKEVELSKERLLAVKEAIIKGNISSTKFIREQAIGSRSRKVKTKLGKTDRLNRRVEIYVISTS